MLQASACNFIKKETLRQVFSCEFWEIFKNTFFIEHFQWLLLNVLPLKVLCHQAILLFRSKECDFDFLAATLTSNNILDFNGYNTREAQMARQSTKPKTNVFYRPLIGKTPSDPSTVLTVMTDTERICNAAWQDFAILTSDQQLYRVMVDITWSNPTRWQLLIPFIGAMD